MTERHAEDGFRLHGRERIAFGIAALGDKRLEANVAQRPGHQRLGAFDLHQPHLGLGRRARRANHSDHFVDIGMRQQQTFDDVFSLPGFVEQELRSPPDDLHPMPQEFFQHPLERQHPRLAIDQGQENQRERVLQRRELIKLIEHDLGIGVALQFQNDAHRLFQIAFVADIGNALDAVFVHHVGNPL